MKEEDLKVYSIKEAGEILHLKGTAMYALVHSGALVASRSKNKILITEDAIKAYLKANEI